MEDYLREKRTELIWALASQGYSGAQIGKIFNMTRANANDFIRKKPDNWRSPWKKYNSLKQ